MPSDCISYQDSNCFPDLIVDYLNQKEHLKPLYNRFPTLENFEFQIQEKKQNFSKQIRGVLSEVLLKQYQKIEVSEKTKNNIHLLTKENTFTVTTGHQLNLFTGPLYFIYKIVSTIKLTQELKEKYPSYNFVPIYWMATEDHDFEEIQYFQYKNCKLQWNKEAAGPVGRLSLEGIEEVFKIFSLKLNQGINAEELRLWFSEAYLKSENLAQATRFLANKLFSSYGLVILDADDYELKKIFAPLMQNELTQQIGFSKAKLSYEILNNYKLQVHPREINLFYMEDGLRQRIVFEDKKFKVVDTNLEFSKQEILQLLEKSPQNFSPNVVLRPLYQECILPNLCYIGGGGELAYWLELKGIFDEVKIPFPMLLLRNSAVLLSQKQTDKAFKLNVLLQDLFLSPVELSVKKTKELSSVCYDFESQKNLLNQQFNALENIASQTDVSFIGAVQAQKKKQLKGLAMLEKRLLLAEKKKHQEVLKRLSDLQLELFPNNALQERQWNFSYFYENYGQEFIEILFKEFSPLAQDFSIITLKN